MRKYIVLFAVIFAFTAVFGSLTACRRRQDDADNGELRDGVYFAYQGDYNERTGWRSTVTIVVADGKITEVDWNAANRDGGTDKKTRSLTGEYGMVELGDAIDEWHVQAKRVEDFLIETQDLKALTVNNDGYTDAVTQVTVRVTDFVTLAKLALDKGPVGRGKFTDGVKYAEQDDFSENSGWKSTVSLTVINGYIMGANWSGLHRDGGKDKKQASIDGEYKMVELGNAKAEWHEQAYLVENELIEKQEPNALTYNANGYADAITGVTVRISDFVTLAKSALR